VMASAYAWSDSAASSSRSASGTRMRSADTGCDVPRSVLCAVADSANPDAVVGSPNRIVEQISGQGGEISAKSPAPQRGGARWAGRGQSRQRERDRLTVAA
jgi:hypothetical protein